MVRGARRFGSSAGQGAECCCVYRSQARFTQGFPRRNADPPMEFVDALPIVGAVRLLILGAGGVGSAAALIAKRRPFLEHVVVADHDPARADAAVAAVADDRFSAAQVD